MTLSFLYLLNKYVILFSRLCKMQEWLWLSLRIGAFGFLKEFRPEDPYITQYLVGPVMNLTEDQVKPVLICVLILSLLSGYVARCANS